MVESDSSQYSNGLFSFISNKYVFYAVVLLLVVLAVYMRLGLIGYQGLFEPDGFFYYAIVKATIANHLSEPQYLPISGFPTHNFIGEAPGLPYLTVIFYLLLSPLGISALTVMRLLPLLVTIIEMALAYLIAKRMSNSRAFGIAAMFFIAVSSGNIARTGALIYRGDTFISMIIMAAIYLFIRVYDEKDIKIKIALSLFAAFLLSTGALIWNGSPYIIVVYMLALVLAAVYSFIKGDINISKDTIILSATLVLTNILEVTYIILKGARPGLLFSGREFYYFYIPLILISAVSYYIITRRRSDYIFSAPARRAVVAVLTLLVCAAVIYVAAHYYVVQALGAAGVQAATNKTSTISNAVGSTTQELQKPTTAFLFASFGLQLYFLAPIGIILFLLFDDRLKQPGRKESFKINVNVAFLAIVAYLIVTGFLQYNAIRYNSLLSLPVAILAAYGLYAGVMLVKDVELQRGLLNVAVALVIIAVSIYSIYMLYQTLQIGITDKVVAYIAETVVPIAMLLLISVYAIIGIFLGRIKLVYVGIAIIVIVVYFSIAKCTMESFTFTQADGINQQFLNAMTWMSNTINTPANSTVLTLWPDGSVVEGWGNRTSYMDSVGGEDPIRIFNFANFLLNETTDAQYISRIHPDYFVSRQYWFVELSGLAQEGIPVNLSAYAYVPLTPTTIQHNATSQFYLFSSQYYNVAVIHKGNDTAANYTAYIGQPGSNVGAPMKRMMLYNTDTGIYQVFNYTGNATASDYTFVVLYSNNLISGGMIVAPTLYNSNIFKLVYQCNQYECAWGSNNVTMRAVYINNDTRIYKVEYT